MIRQRAHHFARATSRYLNNFFFPEPLLSNSIVDDIAPILQIGREQIFTSMLRTAFVLGSFLHIAFIVSSISKTLPILLIYSVLLIVTGFIGFVRTIPFNLRFSIGSGMLFTLATTDMLNYGLSDDGRLFLVIFSLFVLVFKGGRSGMLAILTSSITIILIASLIVSGLISADHSAYDQSVLTMGLAFAFAFNFLFVTSFIAISIVVLLGYVEDAWRSERASTVSLEQQSAELQESLRREQQLASALKISLKREQELGDLRSRVMTTVSHEFRTPLTVLQNSANLLAKYDHRLSAEKKTGHLERIQNSVVNLTKLMQSVELIGDVNNESLDPDWKRLSVRDSAEQVLSSLENGVGFKDRISAEISPTVDGRYLKSDTALIIQICEGLLSNALKFSNDTIDLHFSADDINLAITVRDKGIGVPLADHEHIFTLLERAENAGTVRGLGAGLFISQELASLLGGRVTVHSDGKDKGSTFTLYLPLDPLSESLSVPPG